MRVAADSNLPALDLRVRVPDEVLMRMVGGEMIMLNLERESYYGLNEVGARMMELAGPGATLAAIVERLLEEFEADKDQVEGDVRRLVQELLAKGLLEQDSVK